MEKSYEFIEIDMFPKEVDSPDHWEVVHFKGMLEEVADDYGCELVSFKIDHGTVSFSFDSDVLMAEIIQILQNGSQGEP